MPYGLTLPDQTSYCPKLPSAIPAAEDGASCPALPARRTLRAWLRCLVLALVAAAFAFALPLQAQQFRAAWADVFHVGMTSQSDVDTMVSTLARGHYNVVIVQVLAYMDRDGTGSHGAHWQSNILPWSPRVTSTFDPLAYLCTVAHTNGIQVHAWLGGSGGGPYRVCTAWPPKGNNTLSNNPQWFMVPRANSEGNAILTLDGSYNLDMGSSDAQDYIISIVRELVTNYPIDGINWDDEINGTGYTQGYGYPAYSQLKYQRSGLARYRVNAKTSGTPSNTNIAWSDYRRRFKNELMARAQAEIQSIKTNPRQPLWHTSSPLAYGSAPSNCDFTGTTPYLYFCDWAGMLKNGWLDAAVPQVYRVEADNADNYAGWCNCSLASWQYQRKIYIGLGAYLNPAADVLTQLQYAYGIGIEGTSIYSYGVPCNDGTDWWSYVVANLYTNTATVPTMPWRDPATATNGMIWGQVTDSATGKIVDDATVTVFGGPAVRTDGNGYYVATLIPASAGGTAHLTTAMKDTTPAPTVPVVVLPGDIVRYDIVLGPTNPPAIITPPLSAAVLPTDPVKFTVVATGAPVLSYQWRLNGADLPGQTGAALALGPASVAMTGSYSVLIKNRFGQALSPDALLAVLPVAAWGDSSFAQCDTMVLATNAIAVAAGEWYTLTLRADGGVVGWGDDSRGQCDVPASLQDALAIAAGGYHGLAIRRSGTVVAWGANDYGQANVPANLKGALAVAAGTWHSVALRANGTVVVWGDNGFGQTNQPPGLTNIMAIAAGGKHTLALRTNGTVVAWGENTDANGFRVGQSVVPYGLTNVVAVAAGAYHSLALKADGTVVAWGDNSEGQTDVPAGLRNVVAIAGGGAHSLALRADGLLAAWGADWNYQCEIPANLAPAMAVAGGTSHTVVLLDGALPMPELMNPSRKGRQFSTLVQTLSRKTYALEYCDSLAAPNWAAVCTNAGNGALQTLTDSQAIGAPRFYRMRQW
jgi:uncharacterized lipoprotein YddW (UPF0748 family)